MSWPKILLFGDSITEVMVLGKEYLGYNNCYSSQSFSIDGRWGAMLADHFRRKADVITRGFSGYNTRWCKIIMPQILETLNTQEICCVTLFLGANDCSLSTSVQHVPLDEYKLNLEDMIKILESRNVMRNKVVLITPPIYFHSEFVAASIADGEGVPLRDDKQQILYAQAMIEVAEKMNVSIVDAYSAFAADIRGKQLLCDGLHFTPDGADLLYSLVIKEIEARVLTTTMKYPNWRDVDSENPEKSLVM